MFKDLRVVGLGATASYQATLGSALNPLNFVKGFQGRKHPPIRDLLNGFEGVVQPGQMLCMFFIPCSRFVCPTTDASRYEVVLGRPGSGCSTFLKTLANQRAEYHSVQGEVHYDSLTPADIAKHYRGDVIYCPEDDGKLHFIFIFILIWTSILTCHSAFPDANCRSNSPIRCQDSSPAPAPRQWKPWRLCRENYEHRYDHIWLETHEEHARWRCCYPWSFWR